MLRSKVKVFFEIQDTSGNTFLSRNGNFYINADEQLVDANGNSVMGEGGEISVPEGKIISINDRGEVISGEEIIARLKVVNTEDSNGLEKAGNSYYLAGNVTTEIVEAAEFVTESLERSNVNTTYEMVHMIEVQREYEANQKIIHMSDQTLDKVIRDVGSGIA
jgi:flagellar basal-body rod protein FlgF